MPESYRVLHNPASTTVATGADNIHISADSLTLDGPAYMADHQFASPDHARAIAQAIAFWADMKEQP